MIEEFELERKLFQCGILKPQLRVVRSVINAKLVEFKNEAKSFRYTIGDTVAHIICDWGKTNGYIETVDKPVDHLYRIKNNHEEREQLENLIQSVSRTPNVGNQRRLSEIVLIINPDFQTTTTKALLEEAERILGEVV